MDYPADIGKRKLRPAFIYILPVSALLLGGCIYILLRPETYGLVQWIISLGGPGDISSGLFSQYAPYFPDWFIYTLPNGLWAYSFSFLMWWLWSGRERSVLKYAWLASVPLLIFGFEISQYVGFIPGTFSIPDLISGSLGMVAGLLHVILLKNSKFMIYES